jgi:hypothetical protein
MIFMMIGAASFALISIDVAAFFLPTDRDDMAPMRSIQCLQLRW